MCGRGDSQRGEQWNLPPVPSAESVALRQFGRAAVSAARAGSLLDSSVPPGSSVSVSLDVLFDSGLLGNFGVGVGLIGGGRTGA